MPINDEVAICNMALYELGSDSISSLTDDNERARLCNHFYEQTRDEVLVMTRSGWNCAKKRINLSSYNTVPSFDYDYKFRLPDDCLRVLYPSDENGNSIRVDWERRGNYILINEDECHLVYIRQITDVEDMSPLLKQCISLQLASKIAIRLKKSADIANSITQKLGMALLMADGTEASERFAEDVMAPRRTGKKLWVDEK